MAPHDCRRLLLAHRDAAPAHGPDRAASAPSRTPCLADPVQPASGQPGPRVALASEPGAAQASRAVV